MLAKLGRSLGTVALDSFFITTQIATCPVDWWLSRRIGLTVSIPRDLYVPPGTLVLANHRSMLDPFLVTYNLGHQNWLTAVPMRYPVTPDYARRPVLGRAMRLIGAYDIGKTKMERAKKLLFTRGLLDKQRTVLLFPEGRIVEGGVITEEFHNGFKMLFAHDYPTLFVRLSGFTTDSFIHPKTVTDARIHYSPIIRGTAETKLQYMSTFFSPLAE
ncbi:1-acyl-sn-glycerol-3-phosphate acyltransferase [Patescibacteria group bacterium]|nr:1-acyl-sn-glycerol-3-phosphate acyltransferase [Patescibacteria group bacterium]